MTTPQNQELLMAKRIAIVEQAMSFYGTAVDTGDFGYCQIAMGN